MALFFFFSGLWLVFTEVGAFCMDWCFQNLMFYSNKLKKCTEIVQGILFRKSKGIEATHCKGAMGSKEA